MRKRDRTPLNFGEPRWPLPFYTSDRTDDWILLFSGIPSRSILTGIVPGSTSHDKSIPIGPLLVGRIPLGVLPKYASWQSYTDPISAYSIHSNDEIEDIQ